ncbi:MAG: SapC family protein [Burkholderiales bacterium]
MDITAPYGYQEVVPLGKETRVVLPAEGRLPPVFRSMLVIPLSYTEISLACHDYPVVFVSGDEGKTALTMAVVGLEQQQNLFVASDLTWDRNVYVPAYVRRYPFCMTRVNVSGAEQPERIACVEKRAISAKGDALYNDKGEPLPVWEAMRKLLFEFEADLVRTEAMCKAVIDLGLLEPFNMQAKPNDGEPFTLSGMFRVVEPKINALSSDKLKELVQNGVLPRIYAHLMSMSNFSRLLARRAAQSRTGAKT